MTLVNSVNPFRLEGQKTAAFEICDDLGRAPDVLAIPVGNAGNISAYWAGFRDYADAGLIGSTPRMWGFQAAGAAPLVARTSGRRAGHGRHGDPDRRPGVVGQGGRRPGRLGRPDLGRDRRPDPRRIPGPRAARGGVLRAGVGRERRRRHEGRLRRRAGPDATVVCVLTGHGLKDPTTAEKQVPAFLESKATLGAVAVALGW